MKRLQLVILILSFQFYGQERPFDLPNVTPPSPTVASLMQFEEVPVDYYTGQPSIAIPLFSKNLNKDLVLNLSLQYNTQGIKVDNRSGWVGTGWSLFVGGVVSRTVRGAPDESSVITQLGVLHNDDFWNHDNLSAQEKDEFAWNSVGTSTYNYDTELDLYQFSFLGLSGRFVIVKEGGLLMPKLLSNDPNIKIDLDYDPVTYELNGFTILDTRGYKYYFDVIETSNNQPVSGFISQGSAAVGNIPASNSQNNYSCRSAWHLRSITTANDQELATFTYQESLETYVSSVSRTYNTITNLGSNAAEFLANEYNLSILKPKRSIFYNTVTSTTKKLASINFRDNTSVDFIIGGNHPETGGETLQHIIIKDSENIENKRFSMSYEQTDRLWLSSVTEISSLGSQDTYNLSYYNKESLAPFNSQSDAWGYNYTEVYSPNTIKAGVLSQIEYPTGGVKQFEFEEHTYSYQGSTVLVENDYLSNPMNTTDEAYTSQFSADFEEPLPSVTPTLILSHDQEIDIRLSNILNFQHASDRIKVILNTENDPSGEGILLTNETTKLNLQAGSYYLYLRYVPFNITANMPTIQGNIRMDYETKKLGDLHEYLLGGGVRIKEITFKNKQNTLDTERVVSYNYLDRNNENKSSGVSDIKYGSLENRYRLNVSNYLFAYSENSQESFGPKTVMYDIKTKGTLARITKGGYIGYSNVKVSEQDKGYSLYSFTSAKDYPTPDGAFIYPFPPQPNLDFKRGLLVKSEIYDNQNQKLKEVHHTTYDYLENIIAPSYKAVNNESCTWLQFYDSYQNNLNNNPDKNIAICGSFLPCYSTYGSCGIGTRYILEDNLTSGWTQLKETITREFFYDTSGNASVTETKSQYDYNPLNYQINKTKTIISQGGVQDTYEEEIFYPVGSYPITEFTAVQQAAIAKMESFNMISFPIYSISKKNTTVLGKTQYIYKEFSPDQVLVEKVKVAKGDTPLVDRVDYYKYDQLGNVLEVSQTNGPKSSFVWSYNNMYPVAKITNASFSEIAIALNMSDTELMNFDQTALSTLDNLSNSLPNALVTIFSYNPLVGVLSSIDPRGYQMTYHYDDFNRLQFVKDEEGNLVSENQYNYKGN